ncbi:MAG: NINE protein [Candidatus Heimdallarchaeota archaeon]
MDEPEELEETEELEEIDDSDELEESEELIFVRCWAAGFLGIHRFIKKYWKSGLIFLFTGGLLGVGWAVDLIWLILNKPLIFAQ